LLEALSANPDDPFTVVAIIVQWNGIDPDEDGDD
jgi:hypothetical protein